MCNIASTNMGNSLNISGLTIHGPSRVVVTFGEENFELSKLPNGQTCLTLLPETLSPQQRAAVFLSARRGQPPVAVSIGFSA